MGILDNYKKILQNYKTQVIDEVKERVLGTKSEENKEEENTKENKNDFFYTHDGRTFEPIPRNGNIYVQKNAKPYNKTTMEDFVLLEFLGEQIDNSTFLQIAGLAYGETGYNENAIAIIPYCIFNHHEQLRVSGLTDYNENWKMKFTAEKKGTVQKMRGYTAENYASTNPAAKNFFWGDNNSGSILDYNANRTGRNNSNLMKKAISCVIDAFFELKDYGGNDISDKSIGWHGLDILSNSEWKKWLYIKEEHKKFGFENYKTELTPEKAFFISTNVFQGEKGLGSTITYKSSSYSFTLTPTGKL